MAAVRAMAMPAAKQAVLWCVLSKMRKSSAARVVPMACPTTRAVPSMPLAPPLRCLGAELTRVTLLGV